MEKNMDKDELNNVSGGDPRNDDEERVTCPNCKRRTRESFILQSTTGGGCDPVVYHYKCPNCQYEWSVER